MRSNRDNEGGDRSRVSMDEYGGYLTEYSRDVLSIIRSTLVPEEAKRFADYRAAWDAAEQCCTDLPFPLTLDFELVDACNLHCAHCVRRVEDYRIGEGKKRLGLELYKRLIDEGSLYGLPAISVGNSGEGLLEKDLLKMIEYARRRGVLDIWFSTNGLLLTPETARELVRAKLTRISISIDAFTEETYEKVRGGDYRKLLSNIESLILEKERQGATLPVLRVTFIKLGQNAAEQEDFVRYWCERVHTVGLQDFTDFHTEKGFTAEQVEPFACAYPWRSLMVWANGDVSPCCTFHGKRLVIGNVHDQSLKEIWDSRGMKDLRSRLQDRRYPGACIECLGKQKCREGEGCA